MCIRDRIVTNNIILGKGYTCNVPYPKPTQDIFESNLLWGVGYRSSKPTLWGGIRNKNFLHNPSSTAAAPWIRAQSQTQDDADSLYGNAKFVNPQSGDFTVSEDSPALALGFKNFPTKGFGVTSDRLKALAKSPAIPLPDKSESNEAKKARKLIVLGAEYKKLSTQAELSATGMDSLRGVLLLSVPKPSQMARYGFENDDVVLKIDGKKIVSKKFSKTIKQLKPGKHQATVWRGQESHQFEFEVPAKQHNN